MEVNNLAQILNKFSLDEQSKYEDFIRTNTNTFRERMPLFNDCLERYNSLKKSLRCIDQHENSKNETNNNFHEIIKNLMDTYNSVLIPQIKDIEKDFITATNRLISIAKNLNNKNINDFIGLSKKQTVMEVNNLAQILNKFSLDEQSKYEDLFRSNIEICCETNTLEDKYETGREILLSISINHDNVTDYFKKIDKEYDNLSNTFSDQYNKKLHDFIELSKKQTVMEVNNLAQILNKFILDEQSKYEDLFRSNIEICCETNNLEDKFETGREIMLQ
ncbi:hypothetical protein HCN44_007552 [Aphidius gifuensis]|uniref:Uncharacterized protein n=1 Tax=Aphidius gifuensis TaxID=684658 RepID=A0A834XKQ7_APHGI|nr:hypothetical protein HCN44_007552 [Aphidius gifuensis]